ncbi:MAG: YebC/PmpR family DNA-binding transcriptional regulator [Firmicutes bacterium]|nr:YebC/PmpR family DNA-binding transcriptional regulator [Bacillota bacterium]
MSGHSKWANIKHRKAAQDAKKGNERQKLIKAIIIAAKEGGGDPAMNVRLKAALDRARAVSVPNDTITRAIKRGTGELEGVSYEEITYEGYGVEGVAIIIESLTDNRNRTTPEIRAILERNGGSMGTPGSVAWNFERKGSVIVEGEVNEDQLMEDAIDAGAEDVSMQDDGAQVTTDPSTMMDVREALEKKGYKIGDAEVVQIPKTNITISNVDKARKMVKMIDLLESHDDVQNVFANFEFTDEVNEAIANDD